jgi:hypothetical protein
MIPGVPAWAWTDNTGLAVTIGGAAVAAIYSIFWYLL